MNSDYKSLTDIGKKIIERNKYYINHTPEKYKYLRKALEHDGIRLLLLKILSFAIQHKLFLYHQEYTVYIPTKILNQIRHRTTRATSNRYVNYLCALGVINKHYQKRDIYSYLESQENKDLTNISKNYQDKYWASIPPNHFYFRAYYKNNELDRIEARAKQLIENKIKPSNISKNMLITNNCADIAEEIYFNNLIDNSEKKRQEYETLKSFIEKRIQERGYTTKQDIKDNIKLPAAEIDNLFQLYKRELWQRFNYKSPNKAEKERFNLSKSFKKWIIKEASHE